MKKRVEVICRHTQAHRIIPLKIAIMERDKEIQSYIVKKSKVVKPLGISVLPNGVKCPPFVLCFDVTIFVFGVERIVGLIYNTQTMGWNIVY